MATDAQPKTPTMDEMLVEARAAVASIKICADTSKALSAEATESQKAATSALADAKAKLEEVTTAATQVGAAKTKIADEQAIIASKSDHIQKAQDQADKVRADLDRELCSSRRCTLVLTVPALRVCHRSSG